MTFELSGYHIQNRIARYMIVTLQDLMGENGLNAVLKQSGLPSYKEICPPDTMDNAFDFSLYSGICGAVANTYGPRGAKVFLIRAGRAGYGAQFQIRQTTSIAAGDESCDFIIPKKPMD
jgi:hypothetical protein